MQLPPCDAETTPCASLPHPMATLFVYRCPHRGEIVLWITTGTTDDPKMERSTQFGPFDSEDQVRAELHVILDLVLDDVLDSNRLSTP